MPLATVAFAGAVSAERVSQRMLRAASKELALLLGAEAALVSQLEEGLLREIADYARSERQVARGLSYYLSAYPATEAVLERGLPWGVLSEDPRADPAEVFVLREMQMESVLLVPLVVGDEPCGLIGVSVRGRAASASERHLAELAGSQIAALLFAFEHEERAQRLYREPSPLSRTRSRPRTR